VSGVDAGTALVLVTAIVILVLAAGVALYWYVMPY
jgi:hypothetical protein